MASPVVSQWALDEQLEDVEYEAAHTPGGEEMCMVCHRSFRVGCWLKRIRQCRHVFHPLCLLNWLQVQPNCPLCRFELEVVVDETICLTWPFDDTPLRDSGSQLRSSSSNAFAPLIDWSESEEVDEDYYCSEEQQLLFYL
jgi:hypothetical protein